MSRNVRAAAVALALAGGVYLAGTPAQASNMGFKLERSFDLVRRAAAPNAPLFNKYWVSMPLFPGLGDVANVDSALANKCVGDADGPPAGDSRLTVEDFICDSWQARSNPATAGTFTVSYMNRNTCTPINRNGQILLGRISFTGTSFDIVPDIGYEVRVTVPTGATYSPVNRSVIVGSHDPSYAGRQIIAMPDCPTGAPNCCGSRAPRLDLTNMPYHTMWQTSFEYLCGLEGTDWLDVNPADGRPDTCWDENNGNLTFEVGVDFPTGVFDGRRNMTVSYWNNTEATNGPVNHNVGILLGRLTFTGVAFDLVPGDAYMLTIDKLHNATTLLSPHF